MEGDPTFGELMALERRRAEARRLRESGRLAALALGLSFVAGLVLVFTLALMGAV